MNRRVRQIMLGLAIVIFALITPLIVLYALGFRFTRQQVGVVAIESQPTHVEVYRDNLYIGTAPQTISGVGESSTRISLRLPGYQTWEKRLSFTTGVTSAVRAVLVPEKVQPEILAQNVSQFSLAPNRTLLAVLDSRGVLTIYDETGRVIVPAKTLPAKPTFLLWSPDSTFIAISYSGSRHDIFSLSDSLLDSLPAFTVRDQSSLAWDPRIPGRLLALLADSSLRSYIAGEQTSELLAENVTSFSAGAGNIFMLTPRGLVEMDSEGVINQSNTIILPKPAKKILLGSDNNVALWFEDGSLAMREGKTLKEIAGRVLQTEFSPNGALLYIQTASQELMAYNVSDERLMQIPLGRPYLITRVSQPITHTQWFAGSQHLLYQVGDQIVLTEIDTRDHAISQVIDSTNTSNAQLAVGEDGRSLLYLKRDSTGIVSLVRADLIID